MACETPSTPESVTAYGAGNTVQGSTKSCSGPGSPGVWCTGANVGFFQMTVAGTGPYRVELTGLPANFVPGPVGADDKTTVQFVAGANASGVDFGLTRPPLYCQKDPLVAISCYSGNAAHDDPSISGAPAVVSFPRSRSGNASSPRPAHEALIGQVGAVNGAAYQRSTDTLFTGAFAKRNVDYGPDGSGAIYAIGITSTAVTTLVKLAAGSTPRATNGWARDSSFLDAPGREGLGDLDISDDERRLYAVNLFDRNLYEIDVAPGSATYGQVLRHVSTVPQAGDAWLCAGGANDWRPFALKFYDGQLYVGGVCSGETQNKLAQVSAHVLRANLSGTISFNQIFAHTSFGFPRDSPAGGFAGTWHPWLAVSQSSCASTGTTSNGTNVLFCGYPQPWLTDIEIDRDGSLILGFRDRYPDQQGEGSLSPNLSDLQVYRVWSAGDIIRACWNPGLSGQTINGQTGDWEWEGTGACPFHDGDEYYTGDSNGGIGPEHNETAQGGLAHALIFDDVLTSSMDPSPHEFGAGGVAYLNNTTGVYVRGYTLFSGFGGAGGGVQGKGNGLGDPEFLCAPAPLEVGNRVWRDLDGNGIQDPGEPGIAGVPVTLVCGGPDHVLGGGDDLTATTTTNANGEYYFNSQVTAALQPGTQCELRISLAAASLSGLIPSPLDAGGNAGSSDLHDSDGDPALLAGFVVARFTTGPAGENDHTRDFGFTPRDCLEVIGQQILCVADHSGDYNLSFTFTNLTAGPIYHLFIVDLPPGVTATQDYFNLSGSPIPPGGSQTISDVKIHGAHPGPITFTLTIHDQNLVECCAAKVTFELPPCDCGQVLADRVLCATQPPPAHFDYLFTFQDLFPSVVAPHVFVTPVSPANVTVSPNVLTASPPLQYGGTLTEVIHVSGPGAQPGQKVCLRISPQDAQFQECCSIESCFTLPAARDCGTTLPIDFDTSQVSVVWRDFTGRTGTGNPVRLTSDTGYFWFFDPSNVELVVKVLDGRPINDKWWFFYGALSNVEYTITLQDKRTGATKQYFNPAGTFASLGDVAALPGGASTAARSLPDLANATAVNATCAGDPTSLCLSGGRFKAQVAWRDFAGHTGAGQAVPLTGDTGYFWFFDANNVEVVLKTLDGRAVNGHWWAFYASLSNVQYVITVTDIVTGATKTYVNPAGRFASVGDTTAF